MSNAFPGASNLPFANLQRAGHLGIEFLAEDIKIKGGVRDHVHEYKRVPGGATEPMGRKLYTIDMDLVHTLDHPVYKLGFGTLRNYWESETVGPLVIPTIGTIQAKAVDWEFAHVKHMLNGTRCHVQFREHSTEENLSVIFHLNYKKNIAAKLDGFTDAVAEYVEGPLAKPGTPQIPSPPQFSQDIFAQITSFANQISTLLFLDELEADTVISKIDQMIEACNRIDQTVPGLNDPMAWRVVQALQDLAASAIDAKADLLRKARPIVEYVVPRLMSVVDVSSAIYGNTSRAAEVMLLNGLENPLRIEPNTIVRHYEPTALDAIAA